MKALSEALKVYVYNRDKGKCRICGEKVEYNRARIYRIYKNRNDIPPEFKLGSLDSPLNLILLCPDCQFNLDMTVLSKAYKRALMHVNQDRVFLKGV